MAKSRTIHNTDNTVMEELLQNATQDKIGLRRNQQVEGKIISIGDNEVLIDLGLKSEGVIAGRELSAVRDFIHQHQVGDSITVTVAQPENELGQTVLSLRQASGEKRWENFKEKMDLEEALEVKGVEINKGGLIVEIEGIRGFIPSSQFSAPFLGKIPDLVGKNIKVKVIEVDKRANRLVFSEKAMHAQESQQSLERITPGEQYEGIVSSVLPFGVFVNISGAEGLVHVSEISWEKVNNPSEIYKQGDTVKVAVLSVDPGQGKLNLSIKHLLPNPWMELADKYNVGDEISGVVTKKSTYGVFVRLEDKVEGLIHSSKVTEEMNLQDGDSISCTIESFNPDAKRIALAPVTK
jgi:small subunit ribosomal protein S1